MAELNGLESIAGVTLEAKSGKRISSELEGTGVSPGRAGTLAREGEMQAVVDCGTADAFVRLRKIGLELSNNSARMKEKARANRPSELRTPCILSPVDTGMNED